MPASSRLALAQYCAKSGGVSETVVIFSGSTAKLNLICLLIFVADRFAVTMYIPGLRPEIGKDVMDFDFAATFTFDSSIIIVSKKSLRIKILSLPSIFFEFSFRISIGNFSPGTPDSTLSTSLKAGDILTKSFAPRTIRDISLPYIPPPPDWS